MRVAPEILAVLDRSFAQGPRLVLPQQLDRASYLAVNRVLEAAGGKWNGRRKAHLFDGDAAEAIEPILLTGQVTSAKQEFGAFFSPPPVAARVIELGRLAPGLRVLEPSAGRGALAAPALLAGCLVDCVEILVQHVHVLCSTPYQHVVHGDFRRIDPKRVYDRVLMNPPFGKRADLDHVEHALKFVKPGGRLVAVMSAGVTFRQDARSVAFREQVARCGGTIEHLPEGSFRESGTNVNALIVAMDVGEVAHA
jgi:predicted RNA methylase